MVESPTNILAPWKFVTGNVQSLTVLTDPRTPSLASPCCRESHSLTHRFTSTMISKGGRIIKQIYQPQRQNTEKTTVSNELNNLDWSSFKCNIFSLRGSCDTEIVFWRHSAFQCIPARIQLRNTPGLQFPCSCLDKWQGCVFAMQNSMETLCSCNWTLWTDISIRLRFLSTNPFTDSRKNIIGNRSNQRRTRIAVYNKLETAGNRFQTKQARVHLNSFHTKN